MGELGMRRELRDGQELYRLDGVFDATAATQLKQLILASSEPLGLDFSLVRRLVDVGVAALASQVVEARLAGRQVALLGLCTHQRRLLHYFGLEVDASEPASGEPAEPLHALAPA